jgi:hypothetical protein
MASPNEIPAIREATGAFCRSILDSVLPAIREAAKFQGYAVAVHGSLKRDIDLFAVAWTDHARPPDELVRVIKVRSAAFSATACALASQRSSRTGVSLTR